MPRVTVVPQSTVKVSFTRGGAALTVYSDSTYETAVSQPATITASTTYYVPVAGPAQVVATDLADAALATVTVDLLHGIQAFANLPAPSVPQLANLYAANSVLAATADNSPAPVTLAEGTLLGRATGGNVAALTAAQAAALLGLVSPSKSGAMVMPLISMSAIIYGEGQFYGAPLPIFASGTLDRIGCEITVSGSAGAVIRLGVYRLAANGVDLSLVLDAGTVDGTQAAGTYSITISQAVTPGIYVIGGAVQGGATTRPTLRFGLSPSTHLINRTTAIGSSASQGVTFAASGALPSTATVTPTTSAIATYVRWA